MRILYATDGSEGALAGARLLKALALDAASEVFILAVLEPDEDEQRGENAIRAARIALEGAPFSVTAGIRRGNAAEEIVEASQAENQGAATDLVVVGTQGQSAIARFFVGSVAERVARHAACPVLLARPLRHTLDQVTLGVDGSPGAEQAARWLRAFPLPAGCAIRLVAVVTPAEALAMSRVRFVPSLSEHLTTLAQQERDAARDRLAALASTFSRSVTVEVRADDAAQGLLAAAEAQRADLIVVGSQGASGLDRFLIGSIAEKVLRHAPVSVLVVKASAVA